VFGSRLGYDGRRGKKQWYDSFWGENRKMATEMKWIEAKSKMKLVWKQNPSKNTARPNFSFSGNSGFKKGFA